MYYKIENKECEVYKKLHELRTKELRFEQENKEAIFEKTGLTFQRFLGNRGQQNYERVTSFAGFAFNEKDKIDPKILEKYDSEIVVPNRRTKAGKEMSNFLLNGLQKSCFEDVFKILEIEHGGRFVFPFVEIKNEAIYLFLGDEIELSNYEIIEITKKEFTSVMQLQHCA